MIINKDPLIDVFKIKLSPKYSRFLDSYLILAVEKEYLEVIWAGTPTCVASKWSGVIPTPNSLLTHGANSIQVSEAIVTSW
jgi:hypothetical protein